MKFIHTSDWHLGRIFYGIRLVEDQAYVLDQLLQLIKDEKPDVLILSGDVYDRAVPPPEAVELLDDILSRILIDLQTPVLLISGNHDNPRRLGFCSRLLQARGLHLLCSPGKYNEPVVFEDAGGPVHVYAIPYTEPAEMREVLKDETLHSHNSAMKAILGKIKKEKQQNTRAVIVAHAFVAGGESSESERPLSLGGAGTVDASLFAFADYTALGHLHKPQKTGSNEIHYSGSLLKYSFSEATHTKSVHLVELDEKGKSIIRLVPLTSAKDVRCIEGYFSDLLNTQDRNKSSQDYLMVTLLDEGPVIDVMSRLREVYPNVLHIRKPFIEIDTKRYTDNIRRSRISEKELFTSFFSQVTGDEISGEQLQEFEKVHEEIRARERLE